MSVFFEIVSINASKGKLEAIISSISFLSIGNFSRIYRLSSFAKGNPEFLEIPAPQNIAKSPNPKLSKYKASFLFIFTFPLFSQKAGSGISYNVLRIKEAQPSMHSDFTSKPLNLSTIIFLSCSLCLRLRGLGLGKA